ncbi:hypothetical protein V6Z11_D06G129200 [Gossypium hirsutum]
MISVGAACAQGFWLSRWSVSIKIEPRGNEKLEK